LKYILKFLYFLLPFLIFIGLIPVIFSLPPFLPKGTINFHFGMVVIIVPYYLGLFSFPAYMYVLFYEPEKTNISIKKLVWIRTSFYGAICCSIFGIFIGYMLPFLSCLALITLFMSSHLLYQFEKKQ
jgi:hypothetical protein